MFDQIFNKTIYCLMAAVLVVPEPTTLLICALVLAGAVAHCADLTVALVQAVPSPAFTRIPVEGNSETG